MRALSDARAAPRSGPGKYESLALGGWRLLLVGAVFCVSGASALIYQVAWQRLLVFHSGVGIYSIATIVAAFMGGLGLGSAAGGLLSRRLRRRSALRAFALLEIGIGLFAVLSPHLFYDLLYRSFYWIYGRSGLSPALHFGSLLLPTTLMGMSLPLLVRAAVIDPITSSRTIGALYGVNVLGSAMGALATPWLLIRFLGIEGAIYCGALGNAVAGIAALSLATRPVPHGAGASPPAPAPTRPASAPSERQPFSLWLALYALSGFVALSLEILWFRIVDVAIKSTSFTFGSVLAVFLIGLAGGSLTGSAVVVRMGRPLRVFLTCQTLALAYAGLAILILVLPPLDWPVYDKLAEYWIGYDGFTLGEPGVWKETLSLYLALPLLLFGPPTFLMGFAFAALQRAVQDARRTSGLKVGLLQAANIAGNVAGSLVAGLLLLDWLGTAATFRVLVLAGVVFAGVGIFHYGIRSRFGALGALLLLLVTALPDGEALWRRLHGIGDDRPAYFEEDAAAVTGIVPGIEHQRLYVNGKGHSWLPYGGPHTVLGALPAAIHPSPERVAIVGLGAGDTAWAAGFRTDTQWVSVFEIAGAQKRLLRRYAAAARAKNLRRFLADPRVRVFDADGRFALLHAGRTYDVIEADALRPGSAYSGNLYSVEFFQMASKRLREGGLMCSWAPTARSMVAFRRAFEHVVSFPGQVLVGSNQPIPLEIERWRERISTAHARSYLGSKLAEEIRKVLAGGKRLRPDLFGTLRPNRDLRPRDEFRAPLVY